MQPALVSRYGALLLVSWCSLGGLAVVSWCLSGLLVVVVLVAVLVGGNML